MPITEQTLTTADGTSRHVIYWLPDENPKAMLTLCHGHGEHSGRYHYFAEKLNHAGYALFMGDLRGHGKSEGKRGHIESIAGYKADFDAIVTLSKKTLPDTAHFLGGHSMGGLVAAHYALGLPREYVGLLLSSPWIGTAATVPLSKRVLAVVGNLLTPSLAQSTDLDAHLLSHDDAIVAAYENDPLVHDLLSARAFTSILNAQQEVLEQAHTITLPLYVIHGTADGITSPQASHTLFEKAGSTDKTYKPYEGLYHELFNELERDIIIDELIAWLDDRS